MSRNIAILALSLSSVFCQAQGWVCVSDGFSGRVNTLFHDPVTDHLFIGGKFGYLGDEHVGGIVSFDGSDFYSFGCAYDCTEPFTDSGNGAYGIVSYLDTLYLTGVSQQILLSDTLFNQIQNTKGIIKKVNDNFSGLNVTFNGGDNESSLMIPYVADNKLFIINSYALGDVAGYDGYGGAYYNGSEWHPFQLPDSSDFVGYYSDLIKYEDYLYICGNFTSNQSSASDIARLVDNEWLPIGNGIAGSSITSVKGMTVYQDDLIIYGTFQRNHGNAGEGIMRWNGEEWSDLGTGVSDGVVYDAIVFQEELFVCGFFTEIGGIPSNGVAKWDGNQWCSVGSQFYVSQYPQKFGVYQDELYISAREMPGAYMLKLYKWNGTVDSCSQEFNAVNELNPKGSLTLYPNPTSDLLTINLSKQLHGSGTISIIDGLGRTVEEFTKELDGSGQVSIATLNLAVGLYNLKFRHEEGVYAARFVKE